MIETKQTKTVLSTCWLLFRHHDSNVATVAFCIYIAYNTEKYFSGLFCSRHNFKIFKNELQWNKQLEIGRFLTYTRIMQQSPETELDLINIGDQLSAGQLMNHLKLHYEILYPQNCIRHEYTIQLSFDYHGHDSSRSEHVCFQLWKKKRKEIKK